MPSMPPIKLPTGAPTLPVLLPLFPVTLPLLPTLLPTVVPLFAEGTPPLNFPLLVEGPGLPDFADMTFDVPPLFPLPFGDELPLPFGDERPFAFEELLPVRARGADGVRERWLVPDPG
jgi:hypothetical protein